MSSRACRSGPFIGGLLRVAWESVREQIYSRARASGYEDLNLAHLALFRYETFDGQRPTQIADRMRITKQSINDLLRHLERTGYVVLVPDPTDSRARLVHLTHRGKQLHWVLTKHALQVERELARALGKERIDELKETLQAIGQTFASRQFGGRDGDLETFAAPPGGRAPKEIMRNRVAENQRRTPRCLNEVTDTLRRSGK